MPCIHVIYDPNDTIAMPPPDRMARSNVSAVVLRLDGPITEPAKVCNDLVTMLIAKLDAEGK